MTSSHASVRDLPASTIALKHHHLIVQCRTLLPMTDPGEAVDWIEQLVDHLDMKLLLPSQAVYSELEGNRDLTAAAIISTSHISIHFGDEPTPADFSSRHLFM